jgi:hypothetical protein
MKLKFTYHAQSQILFRGIHESRVAETIRRPNFIGKAAGEATAFRKNFDSNILEVICIRKTKNKYLILTAYYL